MNLLDWFPAVTTSGLLAVALWLSRNLIQTRLTKSVEHEFNAKLEAVRAQLRESEERLKADLRTKEAEISDLRSGAMTALASRQIAIDKRRLEAVDQLWSSVMALAPAKSISAFMSVIKFEAATKRAEQDPNFRKLFEALGNGFDPKSLTLDGAAKARPFLSPVVWASYSALVAMIWHSVMQWQILKSGLPAEDLVNKEAITTLAKAALPHHANFIDKYGPAGYQLLIEELESKLLQDLQAMLLGSDANKTSIEQAADILKQSNEVLKLVNSGQYTV